MARLICLDALERLIPSQFLFQERQSEEEDSEILVKIFVEFATANAAKVKIVMLIIFIITIFFDYLRKCKDLANIHEGIRSTNEALQQLL